MKYPIQVLLREYFEGIVAAILLALFLRFFVLSILYIPTSSMNPGLQRGDYVLGWRLSYGFPLPLMKGERLNGKLPQNGDLISFRFPGDEEQMIIRRVIAGPGERVKIVQGVVHVNGQALEQEMVEGQTKEFSYQHKKHYFVRHNPGVEMKEVEVPKGGLFVLSDNRVKADDSRDWGIVPVQNVESRIVLIWLSMGSEGEGRSFRWSRSFRSIH